MQQQQQLNYDREKIIDLLSQVEVQDQLIELGVDIDDAKSRVNELTSEELAMINDKINDLPAGSGAVGLLVLVFVVFIITDVIGATDIFPFIKPVNTK